MFAHAQEKYSRSVHLRFVAAQDFMIRRCMPRTPQVDRVCRRYARILNRISRPEVALPAQPQTLSMVIEPFFSFALHCDGRRAGLSP